MTRTTAWVVGLAVALALFVPATMFGEDAEREDEKVNPGSRSGSATTDIPPIDVEAPEKTETATFGLG